MEKTFYEMLTEGTPKMFDLYQAALNERLKILKGTYETMVVIYNGYLLVVSGSNKAMTGFQTFVITDKIEGDETKVIDSVDAKAIDKSRIRKVTGKEGDYLLVIVEGESEPIDVLAYKAA